MQQISALNTLSIRQKYLLALFLGGVFTLSHNPFNLAILAIPALTLLLLTAKQCSPSQGFALGLLFGIGHFTTLYSWIFTAATERPDLTLTVIFFTIGIVLIMSFFSALALSLMILFSAKALEKIFLFSGLWLMGEWVRSWIFTGFPWALVGYIADVHEVFLQPASIGGVWLLSLLILIISTLPALYWEGQKKTAILLPTVLILAVAVFGTIRLVSHPTQLREITLTLIQPNVPLELKWDLDYQRQVLEQMLAISEVAESNHIIWPETALITPLNKRQRLTEIVAQSAPQNGYIITGALRVPDGTNRPANSLYVIDRNKGIVDTYDKSHLVPYGEFSPYLGFKRVTLADEGVDFIAGPGPQTIRTDKLPAFSPTICYEIIFPGKVVDPNDRPEWILNIANDSWSKLWNGPHQHYMHNRMRAVEEGLPVVRLSNNGPSGVFDAYGRELDYLGLDFAGVLNVSLPASGDPTLFSRIGSDLTLLVLVGSALLSALGMGAMRRRRAAVCFDGAVRANLNLDDFADIGRG